jgi:hypothetical protein
MTSVFGVVTSAVSPRGLAYLAERNRTVAPHQHAVDYDDIIRLFTHRHTHTLFKRQAAAFRQIAREKKDGLAMADIDPVCRVVQLGLKRLPEFAHTHKQHTMARKRTLKAFTYSACFFVSTCHCPPDCPAKASRPMCL